MPATNPEEMMPCLHCGMGEPIPGGYICVACDVNSSAGVIPVWQAIRGQFGHRLPLTEDSAARPFECQKCGRLLMEFRDWKFLLSPSQKDEEGKTKVCPACASVQTQPICYWCGAAAKHPMADCPVWRGGGMTLENLQERRVEILLAMNGITAENIQERQAEIPRILHKIAKENIQEIEYQIQRMLDETD